MQEISIKTKTTHSLSGNTQNQGSNTVKLLNVSFNEGW